MKLAAIDIGSNAARLQISNVIDYGGTIKFKKLEYIRFPLRLGLDVFNKNKIGKNREKQLIKLLEVFLGLIELYEIDHYMVCATSAMREAENGSDVVSAVKKKLGITIEVIDGRKEAELINKTVIRYLDTNSYLHIDVGGGSTELNLYVNHKKTAAKSFKIGSVRPIREKSDPKEQHKMNRWLSGHIIDHLKPLTAVGTGGNISKIFALAGKKGTEIMSLAEVESVRNQVAGMTTKERTDGLLLNPDRAEVIVPAADIYLSVMKIAGIAGIISPDTGLKDGMIRLLFEKHYR